MEPAPVRQVRLADKRKCPVWSQAELTGMEDFYDVRLRSSEEVEFPAHKLILAMTSSYLKSKIRKTSEAVIVFQNVKSEVLSALIDFIYEGKAVISEAETEAFIETAKKWKIYSVNSYE